MVLKRSQSARVAVQDPVFQHFANRQTISKPFGIAGAAGGVVARGLGAAAARFLLEDGELRFDFFAMSASI